ncbi:sporulation protein YqfC [Paenibacillus beijingensis]|uniref:Sporulation protein YqfC n=1 Tax=Paenibacillus beijingensis TaxID=1126833 RepID=A0A0D5NLW9_9BACL|nr:sporulation protein YqfC [Paenibacillus beijingensis]AJY76324.1 sporulation protein YqfC [Paenibacillus beijingensis]
MGKISRKLRKMTADILDLPQDVVYDLPRMTMIGDRQLYIENHRGVLHFSSDLLKLALSQGELEVAGKDLIIRTIWTEEVFVEGQIYGISIRGQEGKS